VGWIRSYGRLLGADSCNFGAGEQLELCGWAHSNLSSLHWALSTGLAANWIGGPPEDGNEDKEGSLSQYELLSQVAPGPNRFYISLISILTIWTRSCYAKEVTWSSRHPKSQAYLDGLPKAPCWKVHFSSQQRPLEHVSRSSTPWKDSVQRNSECSFIQ